MKSQWIDGPPVASKHWTIDARLRSGNRSVPVAHQRARDKPSFNYSLRFDAKKCGFPENEVRELAHFNRAYVFTDPVSDCGIDGVLCHIALHTKIVIVGSVLLQLAALQLHLVRGLPGATDDFTDPTHCLRIGRHHADGAKVVQYVFGTNGLGSNPRVGKRYIFGNRR